MALALLLGWVPFWRDLWPGLRPDLPLLVVLFLATRVPRVEAVAWGAGIGCLADVLAVQPFGSSGMVLASVAWLAGAVAERVNVGQLLGRILLVTSGTFAAELAIRLVEHLVHPESDAGFSVGLWSRWLSTLCLSLVLWRRGATPELAQA